MVARVSIRAREREEITRRRRGVGTGEEAAQREAREAVSRLDAARQRRDEALKSLLAPPEVVKSEHEAAVNAAQKHHDETVARVETAKSASAEADVSENAAYQRKRDAEKTAAAAEREYEDAMTALHGEPSNEQTKEFDKKAKTTMTPPLRGG